MAGVGMDTEQFILQLHENSTTVYTNATKTLMRIFKNIQDNPLLEKFRKLKLSSKAVCDNLLPANGAMECLFACGFVEDGNGEHLILPMDCDLSKLMSIYKQMESKCSGEVSNGQSVKSPCSHKEKWPKWKFPALSNNIALSEAQFYHRLRTSFDHVLVYEDLQLQAKAIQCIPRGRLGKTAERKFKKVEGSTKFDYADFYLTELMDWFRDDFFRWVNAPDCEICQGKTQHTGMGTPTAEDKRYGAGRVEMYRCTQCAHMTRFPRYNNPGKLLETRRGRCGEWANCFTLICRASGYEARHVLDWTDHVWTEVFSTSQQRWLHCDPGEKALDKPLLYEAGWGKKLTYIVGFSKDEINDVTWRYSANHQELILRRTQCRESWLVAAIKALREVRQKAMDDKTRRTHQLRLIKEGAEFIFEKSKAISAGEMIGRQTGSLEWREARGEIGGSSRLVSPHHSFTPSSGDIEKGHMKLAYCSSTNTYLVSGSQDNIYDWDTGVYEYENIMRNVEVDWNMVYLARTKGSPSASITWLFDISQSGKSIKEVNVHVSSAAFHSGSITWSLESDNGRKALIEPNTAHKLDSFSGCTSVRLCAKLSGGDGADAWQHTQLFRQKRDDLQSMLTVELIFS